MKYIIFDEKIGWDHGPYFAYLETVKSLMPATLYDFAANVQNHDLTSHLSLHDAWLENISIVERAEGETKDDRRVDINTCYLGPFHDLRTHISYQRVVAYDLQRPPGFPHHALHQKSHGDLLVHEVRVARKDLYEHEIAFSGGAVFMIQFHGFLYRVEPIEAPA